MQKAGSRYSLKSYTEELNTLTGAIASLIENPVARSIAAFIEVLAEMEKLIRLGGTVPHAINTLFLNGKKNRGGFPLGIHFDKSKGKYRAEMSFIGEQIKLGSFDNPESTFARYKEYK